MSLIGFLILLVIAAICGAIGQALVGYSPGGCLLSIIVKFINAVLGLWIANLMGLPPLFTITVDGEPFPILWSIIGSALFAGILSLFGRRRV